LVDICGYELPTNLQNFMQKIKQSEDIPKSFRGGFFFKHPVEIKNMHNFDETWMTLCHCGMKQIKSGRKKQLLIQKP